MTDVETPMCNISKQSNLAEVLGVAKIIVRNARTLTQQMYPIF